MNIEFCRSLIVDTDSLGEKYVSYADYYDEKCWDSKFISVIDLRKDMVTFDGKNWDEIKEDNL